MKFTRFIRISFVAAPTFLFLYGIAHFFDSLDGSYGPGAAWTVGHILFLFGLIMFGFVIVGLYLRIQDETMWRAVIARCAMIIGLVGLIAFIRSPIIDIVAGLRASDNSAMGAIQAQLNFYPSTPLSPYYNFGPLLFQLGLLALMVQLAILKPRHLPWWSPVLLLLGFLTLGFDLNLLLVGATLIGFALLPLGPWGRNREDV
jgi:hypothetical protein